MNFHYAKQQWLTSISLCLLFFFCLVSVNFKKNEKIYNAANSEVLKALHDAETDEPEQGRDELMSHYYALACMLNSLNGGLNIFAADQLTD